MKAQIPCGLGFFLMPGNSKRQMFVSIKVVKCREEMDKMYSILREILHKDEKKIL
jgi:hypothetical protein